MTLNVRETLLDQNKKKAFKFPMPYNALSEIRLLSAILVEGKGLLPAKNKKASHPAFITVPSFTASCSTLHAHAQRERERERERDEGLLQGHNGSNTGNGGEPCHSFGPGSGAAS